MRAKLIVSMSFLVMLAGCVTTPLPRQIEAAQKEQIIFDVDLSMFINPSKKALPAIVILETSLDESMAILAEMLELPAFPRNSYSGCHARAHFDYLQLQGPSGNKLYKVWLLSSALLSPAVQGAISYTPENGNRTSWNYHVAAAYTDSNGVEWVIDRLISPTPIRMQDWTRNFEIAGYAVLTRAQPTYYLFNQTAVPVQDPINDPNGLLNYFVPKNVFNGNFFEYSGPSAQEHWGAADLAADSLSYSLLSNYYPQCEWVNLAAQAINLKSAVFAPGTPSGCAEAETLFMKEFEQWKQRGL